MRGNLCLDVYMAHLIMLAFIKKKKKDTASLSVAGKALCSLAIGLTYFNDKFVNFEDHEQIGLDKRFLYGPASASNESNYNGCSVCIYLHCTSIFSI